MDKTQNPGIAFDRIDLFDCRVGKIVLKNELNYQLRLASKVRTLSEDKKRLVVLFGFDLMGGVENPPFEFKCSFLAHYSRGEDSAMAWEEFTDAMALTHVVPFLREFLSNMTNRMPVPALILPPTNVFVLLAEFDRRQAEKTSAGQSKSASPQPPA